MHITVADDWLSITSGPAHRGRIEVQRPREHPIPLNGVKQLRVPRQGAAQCAEARKERVRSDDQSPLALTQARKGVERADRFGGAAVIEQQYVTPFDRPFNSWNQDDAACSSVKLERRRIELPVVKGDSQRVIAELDSAVD